MSRGACDVCGGDRHVKPRAVLVLSPDAAPWIKRLCGSCALRLAPKHYHAVAS